MAAPFLKVTVPLGVPVLGGAAVTVAVKVTAAPTAEGFFDEVRDMRVAEGVPVPVRLAAEEELLKGTLRVALPPPELVGRN